MRLTCPHCRHVWDDTPGPQQAAIPCPECYGFVPLMRNDAAPGPGTAPGGADGRTALEWPTMPIAEGVPPPDAHSMPTIRLNAGGPPPDPSPDEGFRQFLQSLDTTPNHPPPATPAEGTPRPPDREAPPSRHSPTAVPAEDAPRPEAVSHSSLTDPLAPSGCPALVNPTAPRPPGEGHARTRSLPPSGAAPAPKVRTPPPSSGGSVVLDPTLNIAESSPSLAEYRDGIGPSMSPTLGSGPAASGGASAPVAPGTPPTLTLATPPVVSPPRQSHDAPQAGSAPRPAAASASASPPPGASSRGDSKFPELDALLGRTLGGYRVESRIGAGGMGAVFLAHQISLDRKVALKVLPAQFSSNAELLARFTREALSAAQLSHHNVVQVHDVGNEGDIYFISMEYVAGKNLGTMVRGDGRLRLDDAAGYILQAARGLHHAHQRGIVHRDIKPDNLMVNEVGVVKVADLGLAKMKGVGERPAPSAQDNAERLSREAVSDLTRNCASMGTPAYMAPEQARDAASVDARADQYSLGCTLYYLCAGRAPYSGTTVFELISKHMSEPLTPLDAHVSGVPQALSRVLQRMLAKNPEDRYPDLAGVIRDLEDYLGLAAEAGAYTPREIHLSFLETQHKAFYAVPAFRRRRVLLTLWIAHLPMLLIASVAAKSFAFAGATLGLWTLLFLVNFAYDGLRNKTYLFRRVRGAVFGMSWRSWVRAGFGAAAGVAFLYLLGWFPYWIGAAVMAAGLVAAYQATVVRPLAKQRADCLWKMGEMLKELRVRGVSEEALHVFVARFTGEHWEEFFERLFGYEAMIDARALVAGLEKVKARKRFATWRDPAVAWLDALEDRRKQAREQRQLQRVETRRLKAAGLSDAEAARQGAEEATRILREEIVVQPVSEKQAKKGRARIGRRLRGETVKRLYALARAAAGLLVVGGGGALYAGQAGVSLPGAVNTFLGYYGSWGHGGTPLGLAAGILLFLTAFSSRIFLPTLVAVGTGLLVLTAPTVAMVAQPQFTQQTAYFAALALVGAGFGAGLLRRFSGGRF